MSDASVHAALRSTTRLVVVEAPAGCGKTYQAAEFAKYSVPKLGDGRLLVLAHTHAAVDEFAARTKGLGSRVDVRTIDSLIAEVATAYHAPLGLPPDPSTWVRQRQDGYHQLAAMVARLVQASPMIGAAMARRYPLITCDEHQDSSADQHAIVMAIYQSGSAIRALGDPMQYIFGSKRKAEIDADLARWESLKAGGAFEELDHPHRWRDGNEPLGHWILAARAAMKAGNPLDLRQGLPPQVQVIFADNSAARHGGYQTTPQEARTIRRLVNGADPLLVLSRHNETVKGIRGFSGRQVPVWEGHTRPALETFVTRLAAANDDARAVANAVVEFLGDIAVGLSPSAFGDRFESEVATGCAKATRGKPATIQGLARLLLDEPNHKGASQALLRIRELSRTDPDFEAVEIDHSRELSEAIGLGGFQDLLEGFGELTVRRTQARPRLPDNAISTVHKAKGLEVAKVLLVPCDRAHFGDNLISRCALYVALSRAKRRLTLVVSRASPSPLLLT